MNNNNSTPDQSPETGPKDIDIKAILAGAAVDWGTTFLFSFILSIVVPLAITFTGTPPSDIPEVTDAIYTSDVFLLFLLPAGLGFTVLGGYVAARVAAARNLVNSALVGSLGILLGIMMGMDGPPWINYTAILATIPAAMLGGYCHVRAWRFL